MGATLLAAAAEPAGMCRPAVQRGGHTAAGGTGILQGGGLDSSTSAVAVAAAVAER